MSLLAKLKLRKQSEHSCEDNKEIINASIVIFSAKVFFALAGFLVNVVITRTLNVADAGYYFFMLSVVALFSTISLVGLDNAIVSFMAKAQCKNNLSQIKRIFSLSIRVALIGSFVLTVILGLFYLVAEQFFLINDNYLTPLVWAICIIPFTNLLAVITRSFQGLKLIKYYAFFNGIIRPLNLIALFVVLAVFGNAKLLQVYSVYFVITLIALFYAYFSWRKLSISINNNSVENDIATVGFNRKFYNYCFSLWGISCLAIVMVQGVQILLGVLSSVEQVAYFGVANRVALLVAFVLVAINGILSPKFAEISIQNTPQRLQTVYRSATRIMLLATSPLIIITFIFAPEILLLFGNDYQAATLVLRILIMAQFVKVMVGSVGQLLIMSGFAYRQRINLMVAVLLLIVIAIILLPSYGAIGAAIATLSAVLVNNFLGLYAIYKKLNITLF
jgi:O-antigen/teichoic acid export membrane protein